MHELRDAGVNINDDLVKHRTHAVFVGGGRSFVQLIAKGLQVDVLVNDPPSDHPDNSSKSLKFILHELSDRTDQL